jgi:hypothetical protein
MYVHAPSGQWKSILFVIMEHIVALQNWPIEENVILVLTASEI